MLHYISKSSSNFRKDASLRPCTWFGSPARRRPDKLPPSWLERWCLEGSGQPRTEAEGGLGSGLWRRSRRSRRGQCDCNGLRTAVYRVCSPRTSSAAETRGRGSRGVEPSSHLSPGRSDPPRPGRRAGEWGVLGHRERAEDTGVEGWGRVYWGVSDQVRWSSHLGRSPWYAWTWRRTSNWR